MPKRYDVIAVENGDQKIGFIRHSTRVYSRIMSPSVLWMYEDDPGYLVDDVLFTDEQYASYWDTCLYDDTQAKVEFTISRDDILANGLRLEGQAWVPVSAWTQGRVKIKGNQHPIWLENRNCQACPMYEGSQGAVPGQGVPDTAEVMFIGGFSDQQEDIAGIPFTGDAGNILDNLMASCGVIKDVDAYITNTVKCRPKGNRTPNEAEVLTCAGQWLWREIDMVQPRIIVALGAPATRLILQTDETMDHLHGQPVENVELRNGYVAPIVLPLYHPARGLHDTSMIKTINEGFTKTLMGLMQGRPASEFQLKDEFPEAEKAYRELLTVEHVAEFILLANNRPIALDTETTGEGDDLEMWSVQMSFLPGTAVFVARDVWDMYIDGCKSQHIKPFGESLVIAHNAIYDAQVLHWWDKAVAPVRWTDTMVMAYLVGRQLGLKTLARDLAGIEMHSFMDMIKPEQTTQLLEYVRAAVKAADLPPPPKRGMFKGKGSKKIYDQALGAYNKFIESDIAPKVYPDPPILEETKWSNETGRMITKQRKPMPILKKMKKLLVDVSDKGADPAERWGKFEEEEIAPVIERMGPIHEVTINDVHRPKAVSYSCRDADATIRIYPKLLKEIQDSGMESILDDMDIPILMPVLEMGRRGMRLDVEALSKLTDQLNHELQADAFFASMEAGKAVHGENVQFKFNPNSDKQVGDLLFSQLRPTMTSPDNQKLLRTGGFIRPFSTTDTGQPAVSNGEMKRLKEAFPQYGSLVDIIISYREKLKIKTTYTEPLQDWVTADGRLHPRYNTVNVKTGRLSARDPNVMAIPVRTELGNKVRMAFREVMHQVATGGESLADMMYLALDYSQIEMRVMAYMAQCTEMIEAFVAGRDIHAETAARILGVPLTHPSVKDFRHAAKILGFGTIYGMSAYGLLAALIKEEISGWDLDRAEEFHSDYFKMYPAIRSYQINIKNFARKHHYVADMFGRRRSIPEMTVNIRRIVSAGERQAMNHPVQAGAQGILKLAMARIYQQFPHLWDLVYWILQVHDELIWLCPRGMLVGVATEFKKVMETVCTLGDVPIVANIKTGPSWGELTEWDE